MYTKEEINLITLSSFSSLTYAAKKLLLCDFETAEPNFKKREEILIKTLSAGVYNKVKSLYGDGGYRSEVLRKLDKKGISCVTYFSDAYPEPLKNIPAPPIVLYCKGDATLLKGDCFSIVGSRRTPPKMLAECRKFSGGISKVFTVVTGAAEGADTAAAEGAMEAGGKVISVLANGFDYIYPAVSADLVKKVEEKGLVISEYPPETKPKPYYFPVRNRIIAGLSRGTLVVSAGEKSGALITADYAAEFGRDVFAFPYSIGVSAGAGCNSLIKKGAYLAENILDIFVSYGLDFNTPQTEPLSGDELAVYSALKELGEGFLPDIAKMLNRPPHEIIPVICALQIKKRAVSLGGNRYSAI